MKISASEEEAMLWVELEQRKRPGEAVTVQVGALYGSVIKPDWVPDIRYTASAIFVELCRRQGLDPEKLPTPTFIGDLRVGGGRP
jgi:hypothetical protein